MKAVIVNGRIEGTRISVWDVYHYTENEWSPSEIAAALRITQTQVDAAIEYINRNRDEVLAVHRQIEEQIARGNPPEVEAKRAASRAKLEEWLKEQREIKQQESERAGHSR